MKAILRLALALARAWSWVWRALVEAPKLMIERGPYERNVPLEHEYQVLKEEVRRVSNF